MIVFFFESAECVFTINRLFYPSSPELTSNATLKNEFELMPLEQFWIKMKAEYFELSVNALGLLLNFYSTYLCETSFSAMTLIKNKQRNKLIADHAMRIAISDFEPRIEQLAKNVQAEEQVTEYTES